ncbi:hypothetical protein BU16DRAFT_541442 [Lophium mytilinum]|uniref:Uncharacterized protein n=1 Tax=Lophium mytilinum TaxID=390894 RepID=A0A6A6QKW7_9PEZI|nr:hypothetical protein BU16DRAFT_541442 [Lophium mytilinum]
MKLSSKSIEEVLSRFVGPYDTSEGMPVRVQTKNATLVPGLCQTNQQLREETLPWFINFFVHEETFVIAALDRLHHFEEWLTNNPEELGFGGIQHLELTDPDITKHCANPLGVRHETRLVKRCKDLRTLRLNYSSSGLPYGWRYLEMGLKSDISSHCDKLEEMLFVASGEDTEEAEDVAKWLGKKFREQGREVKTGVLTSDHYS